MSNELTTFSDSLASLVKTSGAALVRVDDGTRLTATGLSWQPGVIVTTSHGTERDDELFVITHDGTRLPARLIGRDPETDLAALRIDATDLPTIAHTDEGFEPRLGQLALAVDRATTALSQHSGWLPRCSPRRPQGLPSTSSAPMPISTLAAPAAHCSPPMAH